MEAKDELHENQDKITICVYFKEADIADEGFEAKIRDEIEKIRNIHVRFCEVATSLGHRPPDISVSVLVVPNWSGGFSYNHVQYPNNQDFVIQRMRNGFHGTNVAVSDFFEGSSEPEKNYLKDLGEGSNCLDMMKIKSIIFNADYRHLQLDSNTIITDYSDLYQQTFIADAQYDALNASLYGASKVMPHSKIVYTHPDGRIGPALSARYAKEIPKTEDIERRNQPSKFYNSTFVTAAIDSGVAFATGHNRGTAKILDEDEKPIPEYRITRDTLPVTTQSWGDHIQPPASLDLILSTKTIHGIQCSSKVIESLIKKYVTKTNPTSARAQLISISNVDLEIGIIRDYLELCDRNEKKAVIERIPINKLGDDFAKRLSGDPSYTVRQLYTAYGLEDTSTASAVLICDEFRSAATSLRAAQKTASSSSTTQAEVEDSADIADDKKDDGKEGGFKSGF